MKGTGRGVTVSATLTRASVELYGSNVIPVWKVAVVVSNYTAAPVQLGESMVVLTKAQSGDGHVAVYVARERQQPVEQLHKLAARYGLLWGITVNPNGDSLWPLGALPSADYTSSIFLAASSPRVLPYRTGGYPSVGPMKTLTIYEEILYPFRKEAIGDTAILMPPTVRGPSPSQTVFRFEVGETPADKALSPAETTVVPMNKIQLDKLAQDAQQPQWLRVFALNWLAEGHFTQVADLFMDFAAKEELPAPLRNSATLNLGVRRHKPALALLLGKVEKKSDPISQSFAIESLGEMGDLTAAPTIRRFVSDANEMLASAAMSALGALKDPGAVPDVMRVLSSDGKDQGYYILAARALSQIDSPEAWKGLIAVVSDRKHDFHARRFSAAALGQARHLLAVSTLANIVGDKNEIAGIRMNMLNALSAIGGEEAFKAIEATCNTSDATLAFSALRAAVQMKEPDGVLYVARLAASSSYPYRSNAMYHLGLVKALSAVPTLKAVLLEPTTPPVIRTAALSALLQIDVTKIQPSDLTLVWSAYQTEKDRSAKDETARALVSANFKDERAIPYLIAGLDEKKNEAWHSNIKLLRQITGQKFGPDSPYEEPSIRQAELDKWRQCNGGRRNNRLQNRVQARQTPSLRRRNVNREAVTLTPTSLPRSSSPRAFSAAAAAGASAPL